MPWLQALDLFTLPSYGEEGVPQAIMQAMACGIPVVSTPVGAIAEAVDAGVTGLLVAPRNAAALARRPRHAARRSGAARALRPRRRARARGARFRHRPHARPMEAVFRARVGRTPDMCGIAGFFGTRTMRARDGRADDGGAAPARSRRRAHGVLGRRPRSATDGAAPNALLHTRLSIIDPRPEADQPMGNDAGDVWIAYNGEVYDWADDAETLRDAGLPFPHALRHRIHPARVRALGHRLRARACAACSRSRSVDLKRRAVYVVRDRLGLKPVVYAHRDDGFAFASTVRALLPWLPRDARGFSAEGIDAYLAHRTIPAPRTVFDAHVAAAAGALPALRPRERRARRRTNTGGREPSSEAVAADVRRGDPHAHRRRPAARTLPVVRHRLVAIACRLAAMGFNRLQSFTAAFPGTSFDESAEARVTAERLGFPNLAIDIPQRVAADFRAHRRRSRRAVRRSVLRADVVPRARDDAAREGGAGRRRRRRAVRRLQALREAPAHALAARPGRCPRSRAPAAIGGSRLAASSSRSCGSTGAPRTRCAFRGLTPGERAFLAPDTSPPRALLAHARGRRRRRSRDAARNRPAQLPARLHPAQGRSLHDGARARDARAVPRSSLRRGGAWRCPTPSASPRRRSKLLAPACWRRSPTASRSRARSAASIRRSPAGSKATSRRGCAGLGARLARAHVRPARRRARRRVRRRVARRRHAARRAGPAARDPRRIAGAARGAGRAAMTPIPHAQPRRSRSRSRARRRADDRATPAAAAQRAAPASPRRILIAHHLLLGDTIMLTPLIAKCRARWPDAEIVMTCPVPYASCSTRRALRRARAALRSARCRDADRRCSRSAASISRSSPRDNRLSWLARALGRALDRRLRRRQPAVQGLARRRAAPVSGHADGVGRSRRRTGRRAGARAVSRRRLARAARGSVCAARRAVLRAARGCQHAAEAMARRALARAGRAPRARRATRSCCRRAPARRRCSTRSIPARTWPRYPGTLSLPQLWHLLAGAALLVCPDTGIAHLARLVGVPTVALFGPGSRAALGRRRVLARQPVHRAHDSRFSVPRPAHHDEARSRVDPPLRALPGRPPDRCPEPQCMLALTDDLVWRAARHACPPRGRPEVLRVSCRRCARGE